MDIPLCFTGPRPQKLGGFDTVEGARMKITIMNMLTSAIRRAVLAGYNTFISGGALGVDQWAMEAIIVLKKDPIYNHIKLVVMRPFPSQHVKWPQESQVHFFRLLKQANEIIDICDDPYAGWKMHMRNRAMVDKSTAVIAVWWGDKAGGTWGCLEYALKEGKRILALNPHEKTYNWLKLPL